MVDNLPPAYAKTVVYPVYRELLAAASEGRNWTWCEVCPDAIIGFTPNGSQFSLALHWAQYLSLYAHNHGVGPSSARDPKATAVEVPFPGTAAGAASLFSPVSAAEIARFMVYASLRPDTCGGGRLFNVADQEAPCTYGELWPQLAAWFGLAGVGPAGDSGAQMNTLAAGELPQDARDLTPGAYVATYRDVFAQQGCRRAVDGGVGAGSGQLDSVGYWLTFDRQLSLDRLRKTGFESNGEHVQSWIDSFEKFRAAGLIL
ncbi:putative sirq protein [Rosellinia necatrix]|uniref:Putative sirq protein n=1 Tax=Rosellinia necatrix TaxID=77044 RepID=A0A1S8A9W3_ROSNE|nr:putative sirq protein [Rosellinia necatrix]